MSFCVSFLPLILFPCAKLLSAPLFEFFILQVIIINVFVGQGYGCLTLDLKKKEECIELVPCSESKQNALGPKVCIGAGTGLGECFLTNSSANPDYTCFPSEGGHMEFAPSKKLEEELSEYLKEKFETPVQNRLQ